MITGRRNTCLQTSLSSANIQFYICKCNLFVAYLDLLTIYRYIANMYVLQKLASNFIGIVATSTVNDNINITGLKKNKNSPIRLELIINYLERLVL